MELLRGFAMIMAGGWRSAPGRLTLAFGIILLTNLSKPVAAVVLKHVTDAVVAGDVAAAAFAALFLPLVALLNVTGGHLAHAIWVEIMNLHMIRVEQELGRLTQGPPGIEHHERPDYADRLELLRTEGNPLLRAVSIASSSVALAAQFALTVVLLARVQPLLLLLLAFAVAPMLTDRWAWQAIDAVRTGAAERSRLSTHLLDLAIRPDAAKEIRVFGLQDELRRRLTDVRGDYRRRLLAAEAKGVAALAVGQVAFAFAFVGALLIVVRGAVDGSQSVGDVVLVVTLAVQVNSLVFDIVFRLQWLRRSAQAMGRIAWLRRLVGELYGSGGGDAAAPETIRDGIRLEGVGFRYPGTGADVLSGVDLELKAGSTVALVGENGAGKSTLVKLLCRFYEPTAGRITVDGADLARVSVEEWRGRIAAGFQDFVRFELVAAESVGVGDLPAMDEQAVLDAMERAAARDLLERLPDGLDTKLGKSWTNGSELSGGQWQKLALARAMMRARPLLLVLDEPTASLDAHAEHLLFERYAASARLVAAATGGIAVFVSHRFSTVRMADLILVVDGGRIVERGSHDELVALGGIYAELFALQASAYGVGGPSGGAAR